MPSLLEKLSSYNLFNNLLPGVIFSALVSRYTSYSLLFDDVVVGLFMYYFVGVVIGRVGSLVVEPLLKKFGFIEYAEYADYLRASKKDAGIELLLESSNTYRTICTAFLLIAVAVGTDAIGARYPAMIGWLCLGLGLGIAALFAFAFQKQTAYIVKRVKAGNATP